MSDPEIMAAIRYLETQISSTNNLILELASVFDSHFSRLLPNSEPIMPTLRYNLQIVTPNSHPITKISPVQEEESLEESRSVSHVPQSSSPSTSDFGLQLQPSVSVALPQQPNPHSAPVMPINPNSEIFQLISPPPIPKSPRPPPSTLQPSLPRSEHPWPPPSRFQPPLPQTPPPPIPPQPTEPPPPDTLPLPATPPPKFPPPYSSLQIFSDPPCSSLSTVDNPIAEVSLPTPQLQPSLFQTPPLPVKELSPTEIDEKRERMLCVDWKWPPFRPCHSRSLWLMDTKKWCDFDSPERPLLLPGLFMPHSPQVMLGGEPPPVITPIWNRELKEITASVQGHQIQVMKFLFGVMLCGEPPPVTYFHPFVQRFKSVLISVRFK